MWPSWRINESYSEKLHSEKSGDGVLFLKVADLGSKTFLLKKDSIKSFVSVRNFRPTASFLKCCVRPVINNFF